MGGKAGFCSKCGKRIVGASHLLGGHPFCGDCYLAEMRAAEARQKELASFYDYVKSLFGKAECPDHVRNAVERFVKDGDKTVASVRHTVYYYYEVLGNKAERINEVPWVLRDYYDEARDCADRMLALGEQNKSVNVVREPTIIKIKKPESRRRLRRRIQTED